MCLSSSPTLKSLLVLKQRNMTRTR
uniref:Uncharacterized protein n=1 Tax=Triticum urartu TaxID=4572 RepID=A0A8R7UXB8_TRIUA